MLAACHCLCDVEVVATHSVASVEDVELRERAHGGVAHSRKRSLACFAYAVTDIVGVFLRIANGSRSHFGFVSLERSSYFLSKGGEARDDIKNVFARFLVVFAATCCEALERLENGAFLIGDGLKLVGDSKECARSFCDVCRKARCHDAAKKLRDFLLNAVKNVFAAEYVLNVFLFCVTCKSLADVGYHLSVAIGHKDNFAEGLLAGNLRRELYVLIKERKTRLLIGSLSLGGNKPFYKLRKLVDEGEEEKRCYDVERRMDRRHRGCGSSSPIGEYLLCEGQDDRNEKRHEKNRSNHIEEGVRNSGALSFCGAVECGEPRGDGGSDVHTEYCGSGSFKCDNALNGKRHCDGCGGCRALHYSREDERYNKAFEESAYGSCVKRGECCTDGWIRLDWRNTLIHPVKAHKHESKTHKGKTEVVRRFAVYKEVEDCSDGYD